MPRLPTITGQRPFYGWWIVALGFANNFGGAGFAGYAFAVLIKPMADDADLGWSLTEIVWGITISAIVGTVVSPFVGPLVDRKNGPRAIMAIASLTGGVGIALVSQVQELWQYYLVFGLLVAFLMNASASLVVPTVVSKFFTRRRGKALIMATMGRPLSGIILLPLTQVMVSGVGWRATWLIMGIIIAAVLVPANSLLMRRSPEDIGLLPDGDSPTGPHAGATRPTPHISGVSWTLASAMRTAPFWLILIATNLGLSALAGVLINGVTYLKGNFSDDVAITGATLVTVSSFTSRAIWLLVADRVNPKYSAAGAFIFAGVGMLFLIHATNVPFMVLWAICFGTGVAGMDPLTSQLFANYFGRTFLGSIRGVVSFTTGCAFAAAPLLTVVIADRTGDFTIAFWIFLVGLAVAAILTLLARSPRITATPT